MSEHMSDNQDYKRDQKKFSTHILGGEPFEAHPERITASFVFVTDDTGNILTLKNERGWDVPGGHLEGEETAEAAARREVAEEACVDIENVTPFALIKNEGTAMAVFTARPALIREFVPNIDDPTSDRTFMSIDDFMSVYSGGDKSVMTALTEGLVGHLASR